MASSIRFHSKWYTYSSNGSISHAMFSTKSQGDNMTGGDLIKTIAEEHDLSLAKSQRIVKTLFDSIAEVKHSCKILF